MIRLRTVPRRVGVAEFVSLVTSPAVVVAVFLVACGWVGGSVGVGVLCAVVAVAPPVGAIRLGGRRGVIRDRSRVSRRERLPIAIVALFACMAAWLLAVLLRAPGVLIAGTVSLLTVVLVGGLVTLWWKVSAHTSTVALLFVAVASWTSWGWFLAVGVVVVAAARVIVRAHTVAQTVGGVVLGVLVGWLVFVR